MYIYYVYLLCIFTMYIYYIYLVYIPTMYTYYIYLLLTTIYYLLYILLTIYLLYTYYILNIYLIYTYYYTYYYILNLIQIKNNLRTLEPWKHYFFKHIEALPKKCRSYKKKCRKQTHSVIVTAWSLIQCVLVILI